MKYRLRTNSSCLSESHFVPYYPAVVKTSQSQYQKARARLQCFFKEEEAHKKYLKRALIAEVVFVRHAHKQSVRVLTWIAGRSLHCRGFDVHRE